MSPRRGSALLLGAALAVAAAAPAAGDVNRPQTVLRDLLLKDPGTSKEIAGLLRSGGFVNRNIRFLDLTGDGRDDAVARVSTGGAAGDVALYVLSSDGAADGKLRVLFRRQALYRVSLSIRGGRLYYRVPRYGSGDEICCPASLLERRVSFSRATRRFGESRARARARPAAARLTKNMLACNDCSRASNLRGHIPRCSRRPR